MISSKMNRTNGGNRSSRIFVGILLVTVACLVVLYYHEHRSAKDAEALSTTLEQQTRTLDESVERFNVLKNACREEREQLTKTNQEQEAQIQTALQQAQDWQQRYERVINDKNSLESELARVKSEIQSYQQKLDDKENEVSAARGELSSKIQQCEKDKQSAADEMVKFEKSKCSAEKQQVQQQVLQEKQLLQHQLNQCENSMKGFSDQLKKDTEQQGVSHDTKSVSLPMLEDKRQQKSADGDLEEQIKAKLLSQFTQGDQGDVFTTNNQQSRQPAPILPDNSKDIGNFFESKPESSHKEVDMTNYFKQQQQQQQQQQPSLPPLPVDKSPSPNEDHMIHVGISHVKNESSVNNVAKVSDVSVKEQHDDMNKTANEENDSNDIGDDNDHVGEAEGDVDDDHHDNFDNFVDLTAKHDTTNDQKDSFDKMLFNDDNGNHDNTAENDQDLLNIPRLTL